MRDEYNGVGRKARVIEIMLSVAASAIGSALIVSWTLSATLATYHEQIEQHQRLIDTNTAQLAALNSRDVNQVSQLAAQNAAYSAILQRLDRIERKIDER